MKSLIKNLKMIAFAIMIISLAGCGEEEVDEDEIAEAIAGFTFTVEEVSGKVTFLNISENADSYQWDFGDGETSSEISPVKTYETGTYTVLLTATNEIGSDTFEDEITLVVPLPITLPISFDATDVLYEDIAVFGGASFEIVDNPDQSGSNAVAGKVGAITNIGASFEGIAIELGTAIDLSTMKSISMNFWADATIDVLLKLEQGAAFTELSQTHGGTGWEAMRFDFNSTDEFSKVVIFVDGPGTTAGTFYVDDIVQATTPDSTPPVITLIGDASVQINQGNAYLDQGATAEDNADGDITDQIVVGGDVVDVNVLGEYVITYNVSDAAGNAAAEVTRTVTVVDPNQDIVPPVITLVGDATINLTVGDTYTEQGATASDDVDGDISGNIVVGGDAVDTNTAGTYTVTYNVSDAAGNAAAEVTRTVNVSEAGGGENLLTNGDFETGDDTGWTGNHSATLDIRTEGDNSFFFADLAAAGTNQFDVNLQQALALTQGSSYTLTFDASTGTGQTRNIIAGIGLNEQPFSGIERTIALTENTQTFTETFTEITFGSNNSRVFFDLASEAGVVVIDNVSLVLNSSGGGGGGGGSTSEFCETTVTHLGLAAETASAIKLTIENVDAQSMKVTIESADSDPVDDLIVNNTSGPITGSPAVSSVDNSVAGKLSVTLTWTGTPPSDIDLNILWSKVSNAGNWQLGTTDTTVAFDADCGSSGGDSTPPVISLLGDNPASVDVSGTYTDAGATASDNVDGDITGNIQVGGLPINTSTDATFTVTYNVSDAAGNAAVQVTRTVIVGTGGGSSGCTGTPVAASTVPVDFEDCNTFLSSFGDNGTITLELAENPSKTGINVSNNVLKVTKPAGITRWAGFQNSFQANAFGDLTSRVFKVKIYSPLPNITFRFEAALDPQTDPVTGNPAPVFVEVADANTWTEVTVQFINLPAPTVYNQLVIKPDNPDGSDGTSAAATAIYYFDDIVIEDI